MSLGFASGNLPPGRIRRHDMCQALEISVCERAAHHPYSYIRVATETPLAAHHPTETMEDRQAQAQRRYDLRMARLANPDFGVYGCAVPYNVRLDGGRDDRLVFSIDTEWLLPTETMMLRTEHSGLAGNFNSTRPPAASTSTAPSSADYVASSVTVRPCHLHSPSSTPTAAPTAHSKSAPPTSERSASYDEPHWAPHTSATIWQRAAA